MTITHLRPSDPDAAARLIGSVPPRTIAMPRDQFIQELPEFLEMALGFLLQDFDATKGNTSSSAVGCRCIAAAISALRS